MDGPTHDRRDPAPVPATGEPAIGDPTDRAGVGFGTALYWSYVLSGGRIVVTLGVSLLLAGLLGPQAFGIIAMANVYIYFVDLLVRQGMPAALIQRPDLDRRHLDTAFWMIVGVIAVLIPVTIGLSGWWATVNGVAQLQGVIIGMTPVLALRSLSIVQESQLRRRLEYKSLALRTNLAVIGGGLVGVGMAVADAGVWALVGQQVTQALIEVVVLWTVSDWRPGWHLDRERARDLLGFSGLSSVAGVGVFLQDKVDALLIGLLFGPAAVGLYRMAARLASQAVEAASGALQSVSLPELARHAHDPSGLNRRTAELVHLSTLLAVPALGILAIVSHGLLAVLGEEWIPATLALQILCVAAAFQVPAALTGPLLQAAGRPGRFAWVTWAAAAASGGSFLVAGMMLSDAAIGAQMTGLAASRLLPMVVVILVVVLPTLQRTLRLEPGLLARAVLPVTITVGATAVAGTRLWDVVDPVPSWPAIVRLVVNLAWAVLLVAPVTLAVAPKARDAVRRILARAASMVAARRRGDGPSGGVGEEGHDHAVRDAETRPTAAP